MNMQPATFAGFSLDRELPSSQFVEGVRPTITVLLRDLCGGVLLVRPLKAAHDAFMFPQDEILRHETPRVAACRLLRRQCLYTDEIMNTEQAVPLGIIPVEKPGSITKLHHIVFMSLRKNRRPILNYENDKSLFAEGPNFLWSKIGGCRPEKRHLILAAVTMAVDHQLLRNGRWSTDRMKDLRRHGAVR